VVVHRSPRDVLAGLTFVVFGVAFAYGATTHEIGTPLRMGPGFYPLVVGILLAIIGAVIALRPQGEAKGAEASDEPALTPPAWRPLVLILGALVFFALTIRGLGLIPTVFVTSLLSIAASRRASVLSVLAVATALTVVSVAIFGFALNLRLPLLGPWIPRL
jgi:hypothetical protein